MVRLPVCIIYQRVHFKTCLGKCYKATVLLLINQSSSFGCIEKCDFAQVIERNSLYCATRGAKNIILLVAGFQGCAGWRQSGETHISDYIRSW